MTPLFLRDAVKMIIKQKGYTVLNIIGLTAGLAVAVFILLWVMNELSYDSFFTNKDSIFSVQVSRTVDGNAFLEPDVPFLVADEVKSKVSELEYSSIFMHYPRVVVKNDKKAFYENGIGIAGKDFFSIFSYDFISGDRQSALSNPGNVVITRTTADKYFGDAHVTGKYLEIDGMPYKISGIIENVPEQSHLQFDLIIDQSIIERKYPGMATWENYNSTVYVKTKIGTSAKVAGDNLNRVILSNLTGDQISNQKKFVLQPLKEIYLTPSIIKYILIFSFLALLIIAIAALNYINLSTALSATRLKEIGIKKVVGSSRSQLIRQFLMETFIITIIAIAVALIIDKIAMPAFSQLTHKEICFKILSRSFLPALLGILVTVSVLAGIYPALFLSSFKTINILKGQSKMGAKSGSFRKVLVLFQNIISISLIIATVIIMKQVNFMMNKDLGFNKNNIVFIPLSGNLKKNCDLLEQVLLNSNQHIEGVVVASYLPTSQGRDRSTVEWGGMNPNQTVVAETPGIGYGYFDLLELKMIAGRDFSMEYSTDSSDAFIINEEAARQMNMAHPIGEKIAIGDKTGTIVGVVKDANFLPLNYSIEPQVFNLLSNPVETGHGVLLIKVKSNPGAELTETIGFIQSIWMKYNAEQPFEYSFWGDSLRNQYTSEKTTSQLFLLFSFFALMISCLGLLGLVSLLVEQHKKEIGLRKAMGASTVSILVLLSGEFIKWVLIANILAWPVSYYLMKRWLNDFAFRVEISFMPFLISGGLAILIAILTISYQSIMAANQNPAYLLKYE